MSAAKASEIACLTSHRGCLITVGSVCVCVGKGGGGLLEIVKVSTGLARARLCIVCTVG